MSQSGAGKETVEEDAARWRFGEIVLDERSMELFVGGKKAELTRKPLELLMYLLRNPGEIVTKDELFEAVWPGRIVSESSLTNAMARLRTALGEEHAQQFIKAVYGYGYRFTGELVREDARVAAMPAPQPELDFKDGDAVPFRNGWLLRKRLGAGGGGDAWLAVEATTGDARVFKFARDRAALTALKREITLSRLMRESLGERSDIVRVLDWSLDEAPYFIAVDHCSQGSLSDWAATHGGIATMPVEQRLELLAQAAEALAAAHSVGVLHKDLKPANLLLHQGAGGTALQVRLSDFGSARLVDRSRLSSLNIAELGFTQTVMDSSSGTPLYLAPELLAGHPPTIRSDVYALGVILYQLVVGDLRRPLAPGWERQVEDPLLVEDIAAAAAGDPQHRLVDAAELAGRLRSMPMRREARARERAQRDEADKLKAALDRARARRGVLIALAATLVLGLAATVTLYVRANHARVDAVENARQAKVEAERANAVTGFLADDLLSAANPLIAGRRDVSMREVLDHARQKLDTAFKDQPRARATLERVIGSAYAAMGERKEAEQLLSAAETDLTAMIGPAAAETQGARLTLRNMYVNLLDYREGYRWSKKIVDVEQAAGWPNLEIGKDAEATVRTAACLQQFIDDAVSRCTGPTQAFYLDTLKLLGPESLATQIAQFTYGATLSRNGRDAEALPILEEVYQRMLKSNGQDNLWIYQALAMRNRALAYGGRPAEGKVALEEHGRFCIQLYGPAHRLALINRRDHAHANLELGQPQAALDELREVLALALVSPTMSVSANVGIIRDIGLILARMDRLAEAEATIQDGLARLAPVEKSGGYLTLRLREDLAALRLRQKDAAGAERLLRQNLADATVLLTKGEWLLGWDQYLLGDFLRSHGQAAEAKALLTAAQAGLLDALGADDARTRKAQAALAELGG